MIRTPHLALASGPAARYTTRTNNGPEAHRKGNNECPISPPFSPPPWPRRIPMKSLPFTLAARSAASPPAAWPARKITPLVSAAKSGVTLSAAMPIIRMAPLSGLFRLSSSRLRGRANDRFHHARPANRHLARYRGRPCPRPGSFRALAGPPGNRAAPAPGGKGSGLCLAIGPLKWTRFSEWSAAGCWPMRFVRAIALRLTDHMAPRINGWPASKPINASWANCGGPGLAAKLNQFVPIRAWASLSNGGGAHVV